MPIINNYDALTNTNTSTKVSDAEYVAIMGEPVENISIAEISAEKQALRLSALTKLAALGLTEDEAKAIIG